jgi:capsular exopolysaccharide synthesis family protein
MLRKAELSGRDIRRLGPAPEQKDAEAIQVGPGAEILLEREEQGILADRLRFLRAHLRGLWSEEKLKCLLIASASPNDGKSTVALNLSIVLAEHGKRRVLLIEGDMHYPTITERLSPGFKPRSGLAECLEGKADPGSAVLRIDPYQLFLLPAGKSKHHPTELLQSDALPVLMRSFRNQFDWVVVDSPPVQPLSDTLLLRQQTDATLLVVRSGCTRSSAVDEAVTLLGKKNILGMVINGVEGLERAYSKYYKSYGSNRDGSR